MHEHSIAYQKILKLRKAYLGLNVLSLFILGTIAEVFSHQYAFAIPMFIILFCVIAYISMFYFLAHFVMWTLQLGTKVHIIWYYINFRTYKNTLKNEQFYI